MSDLDPGNMLPLTCLTLSLIYLALALQMYGYKLEQGTPRQTPVNESWLQQLLVFGFPSSQLLYNDGFPSSQYVVEFGVHSLL